VSTNEDKLISEEETPKSADTAKESEQLSSSEDPGTTEDHPEPADEAKDSGKPDESDENNLQDQAAIDSEAEQTESKQDSEVKESSEPDSTNEDEKNVAYFRQLVDQAKELIPQTDWAFVTVEFENLINKWSEGPETDNEEVGELYNELISLKDEFHERKNAHYEELNRQRQENLNKKKELLTQLSEIVKEERWSDTKQVKQIKNKWESIHALPKGEGENLDSKFQELIGEFEDHKVDRLVQKRQKEEDNLVIKLVILDKMEALVNKLDKTTNFKAVSDDFEDLLKQWRKVGRVPVEKNEEIWDRYNKAQDDFNSARFKFDKKYRQKIEKYLKKKKALIEEAEALVDAKNLANAARKVNKLHRAWKKTGNLPQKDENELWDKFKAATDAFNQKKSDNMDLLRKQEDQNLEKKHELIEQAEALKEQDIEDWNAAHQKMQSYMDKWKNIGPVPRNKSRKIWKKFKGVMDEFYDKRREHMKEVRGDQKENLEKKKEIIEKLRELGSHEDPAAAVEEAKKLQEEFKNIGYVPIKQKNKTWKQYREACDVIYDRFRALGSDLGKVRELAAEGIDPKVRKDIIKKEKEVAKLRKQISRTEEEVLQHKEAKTYFKPTNKGKGLRQELQDKIDKGEALIEENKKKLKKLIKDIDLLRQEGSNDE